MGLTDLLPVARQPEPSVFDSQVRTPGSAFLANCPRPQAREWRAHSYWRRVLPILHDAYKGICAYSCHWISYDTGADTVEHFRPKDQFPDEAYEWDNYRLVCATLNARKGVHQDVLDPFCVQYGWFVLDFPSLLVRPGAGLAPVVERRVQTTIDRLGLNDEGTCMKSRERYVKHYCQRMGNFEYLCQEAPFIASELTRQYLIERVRDIMGYDPMT
jgi:hypothetical protein